MDKQGNLLKKVDKTLKRCEEYTKDFYNDVRGVVPQTEGMSEGPSILKSEITVVIAKIKNGKAVGEDGVMIEMVRAPEEWVVGKITELANKINETGYMLREKQEATFLTNPKKSGTTKCEKHRTTSINSQMGKLIPEVLKNRLKRKVDEYVAN